MREERNSKAEVDFIIEQKHLIPIEVKSGKTGRLKSLHIYLQSHPNAKYGVRISEREYAKTDGLLQIPLYAIEAWLAKSNL